MKKITISLLFVLVFTMAIAVAPVSACGCDCGCADGVGTPGYWKNHPEAWPVDVVELGGTVYTKEQAIALMNMSVKNDKSITVFKAAMATKLNKLAGNESCCVASPLGQAEWWLATFPVGSGVEASSDAWQVYYGEEIYWKLDAYNNGELCAPARE